MKALILDETGNHRLSVIEPEYPVFGLGGFIADLVYILGELTDKLNLLKQGVFNRQDIILHTADIVRNCNGFEMLADKKIRENFYRRLNSLMTNLDYSVLACAINKQKIKGDEFALISPYGDAYTYFFSLLVERFVWHLIHSRDVGIIIAESRGATLDKKIQQAWVRIKKFGTNFVSAKDIVKYIKKLEFVDKQKNFVPLQLADLIMTPIGRHVIGKPEKKDFRIIKDKFLMNPATKKQDGLIIIPEYIKKRDGI